MWMVHSKSNKDSQLWPIVGAYDNKMGAMRHASRLLGNGFKVLVKGPDGKVINVSDQRKSTVG